VAIFAGHLFALRCAKDKLAVWITGFRSRLSEKGDFTSLIFQADRRK
jgi:hypothetical protein